MSAPHCHRYTGTLSVRSELVFKGSNDYTNQSLESNFQHSPGNTIKSGSSDLVLLETGLHGVEEKIKDFYYYYSWLPLQLWRL